MHSGNPLPRLSASARCEGCAIRHSSVCGALSGDEIAALNALARRKRLAAGETYLMEGDTAGDFGNITRGVAKLVRGAEDGRLQIVGLLFQSDFVGSGLEGDAPEEASSIEAVTDLELCLFPRKPFQDVLARFPSLEHRLLKRALDELRFAREWMVLLGRKTAEERVATFMLHMARRLQTEGCHHRESFDIPLNRAEIADYIGLTLETVSRQMTKLRKDGIVVFEGAHHVQSIDHARLVERAGF
ncbi:MAG: Crp/Fnr family transcriptional regulator [Pseudomonadota bacterium]